MNVVVYDYKEFDNIVVHTDVKKIEDSENKYITLFFESGRYLSMPYGDFNYIKLM